MDYDPLDLFRNDRSENKSEMNLKDEVDESDISLVCRRFPSIMLGSASQVDLYDGTASNLYMMNIQETEDFGQHSSDSYEARLVQNTLSEACPSMYDNHSSVKPSSLREEDSYTRPLSPLPNSSMYEEKLDQVSMEDDSQKNVGLPSHIKLMPNELFLDKSIGCVPELSKRNYRQLENCGFHTVSF